MFITHFFCCDADPLYEKRSSSFYVPRDESFAEIKQTQFKTSAISSGLSAIFQSLDTILTDQNLGFVNFEDIETLYKEGFHLPPLKSNGLTLLQKIIPKLIKVANDSQNILRFDTPEPFKSKFNYIIKLSWDMYLDLILLIKHVLIALPSF